MYQLTARQQTANSSENTPPKHTPLISTGALNAPFRNPDVSQAGGWVRVIKTSGFRSEVMQEQFWPNFSGSLCCPHCPELPLVHLHTCAQGTKIPVCAPTAKLLYLASFWVKRAQKRHSMRRNYSLGHCISLLNITTRIQSTLQAEERQNCRITDNHNRIEDKSEAAFTFHRL